MAALTEDHVLAVLRTVTDPDRGTDIVTLGMVAGLSLRGGAVTFALEVDPARGARAEPIRHAAEAAVKRLAGVTAYQRFAPALLAVDLATDALGGAPVRGTELG